jgi:serine/threonine protein kinase
MQILHQEMSAPWHSSRFVAPYIAQLSPEVVDLLNQILQLDPHRRIGLEGILAHPWMNK